MKLVREAHKVQPHVSILPLEIKLKTIISFYFSLKQ